MKSGKHSALLTILVLISVSVLCAGAGAADASYAPDSFFVKYLPASAYDAALPGINTYAPAEILADYRSLVPGLMLVGVPDGVTVEEAIDYYAHLYGVAYVEPNYYVSASSVPDDPEYSQQWGLRNTPASGGISAETAWDISTGNDSVIVAVVDSGVDIEHPDLKAHIWNNTREIPNGIDDDGNGYIDDFHGWNFVDKTNDLSDYKKHGTHCAGIVGAVTNNGEGIAGTAWNVTIMPVKVMNHLGVGSLSQTISGIQYATEMGAHIISLSLGGDSGSETYKEAIAQAGRCGILCVVSAGNDYGRDIDVSPTYPASYDCSNILTVAATNWTNSLADFSNYGYRSVEIAAPGVDIYSTVPNVSTNRTLIYDFGMDEVKVLGSSWYCGYETAYIHGENQSLIYYNRSIMPTDISEKLALESWYKCNLSADKNSSVRFLLSNRSFDEYTSIIDFVQNGTGYIAAFTLNNVVESKEKYMGMGFTKNDTKIGNGPYYLGVYYQSTTPGDEFNLTGLRFTCDYQLNGHEYMNDSGTSMSTPMVAGAAAVMKAVNPSLTPEQIIQIINDTADTCPALIGKVRSGGRLNFSAALMKARPEFEVAFNSTGGTDVPAQQVFYGSNVTRPSPDPTRDGYVFEEWYNDSTFSTPWNFATDKIYLDTVIYANWTLNTSSTTADVNGTATFGGGNLSALHSTADDAVSSLLLEDISNLSAGSAAIFAADNTSVPEVPSIDGRTTQELAVFDLTATVNASAGEARFNLTLTFSDDETRQKSMDDIRIWHYNASLADWDDTSLDYAMSWNGSEVTYTVYTTSFSPFGVGLYPIISAPAPAYSGGSSSRHQGGSILLQPGEVAPNSYATTAPTVAPTVAPTAAPTVVPAAPTKQPTTKQTQASPAPVAGLIAGLGIAALGLARLRK